MMTRLTAFGSVVPLVGLAIVPKKSGHMRLEQILRGYSLFGHNFPAVGAVVIARQIDAFM
jgi:hypothetical protein